MLNQLEVLAGLSCAPAAADVILCETEARIDPSTGPTGSCEGVKPPGVALCLDRAPSSCELRFSCGDWNSSGLRAGLMS